MNPQDEKDTPGNLLRELETLQRVLDGAADDQIELEKRIPVLNPLDDIPLLDELFGDDNAPVLKAVNKAPVTPLRPQAPAHPVAPITAPAAMPRMTPANVSRTLQDLLPPENSAPVPDTASAATPSADAPAARPRASSGNPFLPQSVLDRLTQEREAAQQSAEEAHRTMQKVMEQKQQRAQEALTGVGNRLTPAQKEALIDQIIAETLPQITERLRDKLRLMLNR